MSLILDRAAVPPLFAAFERQPPDALLATIGLRARDFAREQHRPGRGRLPRRERNDADHARRQGGEGLSALLPIDTAAVATLREDHGIYMPASGRINVAGLGAATVSRFVAAPVRYLPA